MSQPLIPLILYIFVSYFTEIFNIVLEFKAQMQRNTENVVQQL